MAKNAPSRSVAFIPASEVAVLRDLRAGRDLPALRRRILALRKSGWTLAGIGAPFEVPYSTVRAWENAANPKDPIPFLDSHPVPAPGRPPRRPGHVIRIRKVRPDVPVDERPVLNRLAQEARVLRRSTSAKHPAWKAQTELESMLALYMLRGVPVANLARYCGVSNRAIAARMERAAAKMDKESAA